VAFIEDGSQTRDDSQTSDDSHIGDALLRAVIDTAVDGIMVIDDRGVVRLYNAACKSLFGYAAEEVVGNNVKMLMPARYRDEHDSYLDAYSETGEARIIGIGREVTGQRKDGSQFPIWLSVGEARHGQDRLFVGIVHDITEQKLSEERLRKAKEEAESANRAKSDFLAVMSHEIRTPLHGILATSSLLQHTELGERQQRHIETLQKSGQSLLEIVDNILDLAKIESGAVELKEEWVVLSDLLESVELLWESRLRERGLEYFTKIAHDVPPAVISDADRIREILNNLISNAVKFTEHGYVAVKVHVERPDGTSKDGRMQLRFEVTDTGIGIDQVLQSRLFGRFEQGDTSLTRQHGGTGLGLAICKELCTLLGGEIGVESALDKGSRFWFTVACTATDAALRIPQLVSDVLRVGRTGVDFRPLTILVAEDSPTNQEIIRDILEYLGHAVEIAANGREAVRAAERGPYDMILMDIRMPIMDGLEATRRIRERLAGLYHVPIIALTAHAMSGVRERCFAVGMDDYLAKPFTASQVDAIVTKHTPANAA
jgi:PAS domain S-box-containing protein